MRLWVVLLLCSPLVAQDYVIFPRGGATTPLVIKSGPMAQAPQTCHPGTDVYIALDAPAGTQWRPCNAGGGWYDNPMATSKSITSGTGEGQVPMWSISQQKYVPGDPIVSQSSGANLHVNVDNFPVGQSILGSVAVSNFPATQPVSGTFWQATQPVSGTFWQATQPVSGTFWQATQPVSIASMPSTPVTGTFFQSTQPVSGTFWQATQPVSGSLGRNWNLGSSDIPDLLDRAARLLGHVTVDSAPTTAVTGTFFQATQPVSATSLPLPSGAAQDSSLTTIDSDIKAAQSRKLQDGSGNGITSVAVSTTQQALDVNIARPTMASGGMIPVMNVMAPPPLSAAQLANPLLYRAAMQSYCKQNLAGCAGVWGGK